MYRRLTLISVTRTWHHSEKCSFMSIEIRALQNKDITNLDLMFQVVSNISITYVILSCDSPRKRISALWSLPLCSSFTEKKSDPCGWISRSVGANFALFIPCMCFQLIYHPTYTLLWCNIYDIYRFLHISTWGSIFRDLLGQRCKSQKPHLCSVPPYTND